MQPDDDKTQAVTVISKGTVINHYRIVDNTSYMMITLLLKEE
jgi:hypothetical protein